MLPSGLEVERLYEARARCNRPGRSIPASIRNHGCLDRTHPKLYRSDLVEESVTLEHDANEMIEDDGIEVRNYQRYPEQMNDSLMNLL